jgi:hypothetical protein
LSNLLAIHMKRGLLHGRLLIDDHRLLGVLRVDRRVGLDM